MVTTGTPERRPLFARVDIARVACRAFTSAGASGDARLLAWVLMPDHVHWLLQLGENDPLARVVGRMKASVTRALRAEGHLQAPAWDRAFHDHALRRGQDVRAAARYIIANPLRAGLVARLGDYPFWDAIWLQGGHATGHRPTAPPV